MEETESIEILDGGIKIIQDDRFYKFTSDAVLLSRFAEAKKEDVTADLCSGSGIVGFNFYALNPVLKSVHFFELQKELYDLSVKSIKLNKFDNFYAENVRIQNIDKRYNGFFSVVLCNPPYEKSNNFARLDKGIALARQETELSLAEVMSVASRILKFGGRLYMVHRADRLADVFYEAKLHNLEPKRLRLVSAREDKEPYLACIAFRKGGKSGLKIDKICNTNKV